MRLYRVRVEFDVMVVARDARDAECLARSADVEPDAIASATAVTSRQDLHGRGATIPYVYDDLAAAYDPDMTCAEWLDYLATLPPSDAELEAQGQSTLFKGDKGDAA